MSVKEYCRKCLSVGVLMRRGVYGGVGLLRMVM